MPQRPIARNGGLAIQLDQLTVVAMADNFRMLTRYARQNELMRKSIHPVEMRGLDLRVVLVAFLSTLAFRRC
jgi:hypothetical protein